MLDQPLRLVLASASPRRLSLLRQLGLDPESWPADVDEGQRVDERPVDRVARLAEAKARRVAAQLVARGARALVLGADTEVVLDGRTLGKPRDAAEATTMLRRLRGRGHEVLTGVFLLRTDNGRSKFAVERTRVRFREYDERAIAQYVATGDPLDKAGAYGIQECGNELVERIEGSWSNVVGLPVERLAGWLSEIGVDLRGLLQTGEGIQDV